MSLRLRLVLAFLAIVSLLAGVGAISLYINRGVRGQVAHLTRTAVVEFEEGLSPESALEIEGYWDEGGSFVATEIEKLPRPRRPKLRGPIQAIDRAGGTFTMYGAPIRLTSETTFEGAPVDFETLSVGDRVEVSCKVEADGAWTARKIRVGDIKQSDKIKGTVTGLAIDGVPPDTLEIAGIRVSIPQEERILNPMGELHRIAMATQLAAAVQEAMSVAHLAVRATALESTAETADEDAAAPLTQLRDRLDDSDFYLEEIRRVTVAAAGDDPAASGGTLGTAALETALWLDPLAEKTRGLRERVAQFEVRLQEDAAAAEDYLHHTLYPYVQDEVLALIYSYQSNAEEELRDEVRTISRQAGTTSLLLLITSAVATLLAIVLGIIVWRSISRPVLLLQEAAVKIGRGQLDTRVDVRTKDELGVLGIAFNQMAEQLAASTVSVRDLNNVIDSMAGALLILDADGKIVSVNRAALALLGYDKADLVGEAFERICPAGESASGPGVVGHSANGILNIEEKVLVRKDGSRVPVSFSGAALHGEGGSIQGFVCVAQDLTERKRIEEQIRQSLAEKELLVREVHHRVKNNLQVISSLLDLQSGHITSESTLTSFTESQNRIRSMALIHEQLYRATDLDRIDFHAYIQHLSDHLIQSLGGGLRAIELDITADDTRIDIDRAMACGLIINELVTNAIKHAFPDQNGGRVSISFRTSGDGEHVLTVADDGRGIREDVPSGQTDSLGMTLVNALVRQLRGELRVSRERGTTFRIVFPSAATSDEAVAS